MANFPRFRYGDAKPVVAPWKQAFPINIGDMTFLDTSDTVTPPNMTTTTYPVKPANNYTWQTAIADPTTAPTITGVSATNVGPGFTVAGTGIAVAYTYVTADGVETTNSSLSARMNTNGNAIQVTGVAAPAGVRWVRWYVTTDGGNATTLQFVAQTDYGLGLTIGGPPPSTAPNPPTATGILSALLLTQIAFVKSFLGVSAQYYGGDALTATTLAYGVKDGYMRIDTGGFFDFNCASANFNEGDLVGPDKASAANTLDPQTVVAVSSQIQAVGRVAAPGTALTTVRVNLFSTKERITRPSLFGV